MRVPILLAAPLLLLVCSIFASSTGMASGPTYRWVDKDGVVHYSDRPAPGAQEVQLPKAPLPGSVAPGASTATGLTQPPEVFRYTACLVSTPLNDQVFSNVNSVSASLQIEPGLRQGDLIQVQLDGSVVGGWPPTSTSFFLNDLFRGTHSLLVVIRDSSGKALCSGPPAKFHVTQPSVLSPARR